MQQFAFLFRRNFHNRKALNDPAGSRDNEISWQDYAVSEEIRKADCNPVSVRAYGNSVNSDGRPA